ncbi:unnamed protein product [Nippostrongylus brasiliensis]|uniref:guanylate cyclase n=1 Tax=Nippostrongylus brasiliensis TaxID=27835 RepID=A0A158R0E1_NIPBR|nr:unnamed protein product [Nippostrongylus brasiliensis]
MGFVYGGEYPRNVDKTWFTNVLTAGTVIKVGLLFVKDMPQFVKYVGYRTSASAVLIARDRIQAEGLLPGFTFEFITMFDECNEETAAGLVIDMINHNNVDIVFGPTCSDLVILCIPDEYKRRFMLYLLDGGYLNPEFMFIFVDPSSKIFAERYVWKDLNVPGDGRDEDARTAFSWVMAITDRMNGESNANKNMNFSREVVKRMRDPPFNCSVECDKPEYQTASQYADQLHDALYAYALALNRTLPLNGTLRNGRELLDHVAMKFHGANDDVIIGPNGTRYPTFYCNRLNENFAVQAYGTIFVQGFTANFMPLFTDESRLWLKHGGPPPAVPKCGFQGRQCPLNIFEAYKTWFIVAIAIFIFVIISCIGVIIKYQIEKMKEEKRLNTLWQIPFVTLKEPNTKGDVVAARKHEKHLRVEHHEGLHWRIGLEFLHRSPLQCHGFLTSENCLIDDRWQVKISEYGLEFKRFGDKPTQTEQTLHNVHSLTFHGPPRLADNHPTSFAIIAAQLITMTKVWDLDNRKEDPEEIIYMLKKGGYNAPRPNLEPHETVEASPALVQLHLIRDCWAEHPSERPTIVEVHAQFKSMQSHKDANLMDHVFKMLETHASTLEEEVEERTKELVAEKKKSDILLYRMLPRQVADKLKLGQAVEPESYESVTLFFSDVVSFTNIAAKGTPLQVETIGDAYLCVSGLPKRNGNEHIKEICSMSLGFMSALVDFRIPYLPQERLNVRIGLHTGSVVAGVVGLTMPRYCLFGDAVNTASRMESNGKRTTSSCFVISASLETFSSVAGYYHEHKKRCASWQHNRSTGAFRNVTDERTSASAVLIARDVVREQGLLPGYTFEFITMFDECDEERATGLVIDMINERKVDVVIGPTCSDAAIISAIIAAYYNVPLLTWGLSTSSALDNPLRFPTTVVLSVNSYSLGVAIRSVLLTFDWDQFAMVYSTVGDSEESCLTVKSDIQDAVNHLHDVTINYSGRLFSMSKEAVQFTMEIVKDRARIVILCIPDVHKRTFMLHLLDAGYLNSEFVFIFVDPTSKIFVISERGGGEHYVWMDENVPNDGRDEDAKEAFSWVMSITDRLKGEPDVQGNQTFSKEVVRRMRDPPFNCIEECDKPEYQTASQYAPQLYDTFYTYAVALNRTLPSNRTLRNGREILRHIAMKFQGVSSEIMIGPNGTRYPTFYFNGIAENYKVRTYGKIFVHGSIGVS